MKTKYPQKNKKKIFKILSISVIVGAFASTIVAVSVDWNFPKWIFTAGSSTLQPLMKEISMVYRPAEISANGGGSSFGIKSVVEGKKNIGMLSKAPSLSIAGNPLDPDLKSQFGSQWKEQELKTITIATDAIGIIYKNKANLSINENNIHTIYEVFAGYKEYKLSEFNTEYSGNDYFVPFARSGGSKESGTAEAFLIDNKLGVNGDKQTLSQIVYDGVSVWDALKDGKYGPLVKETNESNLETWEVVKGYSGNGIPITYLSAGFIKNNYTEILDAGFNVALYGSNDEPLINTVDNSINSKYNWYRPLNLLTSINSNAVNLYEIKLFIQWLLGNMLFENSSVMKILNEIGFVPLETNVIKTMFKSNSDIIDKIAEYAEQNANSNYDEYLKNNSVDWSGLWFDDYNLLIQQSDVRVENDMYYGAIFS